MSSEILLNLVNSFRKDLDYAKYSDFLEHLKGLLNQDEYNEDIKILGNSLVAGAASLDFKYIVGKELCDCLTIAANSDDENLFSNINEHDTWCNGSYWAHDAVRYFKGIRHEDYVIDRTEIKVVVFDPDSNTSKIATLELELVKGLNNCAMQIFPSAEMMSFVEVGDETAESFIIGLDYAIEFLKPCEISGLNLRWSVRTQDGLQIKKLTGGSFAAAFSLLCVRLLQAYSCQE